ncbi:MAG: hypothetical protein E6G56_08990 [Actinobacteria bacterium]|nr:MAG: hypothetical protein E6G56_08990 [Actinomycetota bacterium]
MAAAALLAAGGLGAGCGSSSHGSSSAARSGPAPSSGAASFVLGRWHGQLHQRGRAPFDISVTVGSLTDRAANPVRYTGINCGGHWTYLGASGQTVRFREVIDSGQSKTCKGVGAVSVTRAGAGLRYEFRGGGVVSRGLLSRG